MFHQLLSSFHSAVRVQRFAESQCHMRQGCKLLFASGILICLIGSGVSTATAQTADSRWTNPLGGAFHDSLNWDAGVPDSDIVAIFDLENTYEVELDSEATARGLEQSGGDVYFHGGNELELVNDLVLGAGGIGNSFMQLSDSGTNLNVGNAVRIGDAQNATLNVGFGASLMSATYTELGSGAGIFGEINVFGTSQFSNANELIVGGSGIGVLRVLGGNINTGGEVTTSDLTIGNNLGSDGAVVVNGHDAIVRVSGSTIIGNEGNALLEISNAGQLMSGTGDAFVGAQEGSAASVFVQGVDSQWSSLSQIHIGGSGEVLVREGGSVQALNFHVGGATGAGMLEASGEGTNVQSNFLNLYENGSVRVNEGATFTTGVASISDTLDVSGVGSSFQIQQYMEVLDGGQLIVGEGALVTGNVNLGRFSEGRASVINGGILDMGSSVSRIGWGTGGEGELNVSSGGSVQAQQIQVGSAIQSDGTVTVFGDGSSLSSEILLVGSQGVGRLHINQNAMVNSRSVSLGSTEHGVATVDVERGGVWQIDSILRMGDFGNSTLSISSNSAVRVGGNGLEGQTVIGLGGAVEVHGGQFSFGTTDIESFSRISGTSGILAGDVQLEGYNAIASLDLPEIENLDTRGVRIANQGVIYGDGTTQLGLRNTSTGEVRTRSGEWARFGGLDNLNAGEINNFGGLLEFENDLTNTVGGFIGGRGQFVIGRSFINEGSMAFSAGDTDILGDFENSLGGQVVTSGHATTTFFDDVIHNGTEIRTSAGSSTVFFGGLTGGGDFTGVGDVFVEGDLRPGNSPDVVSFGGSLHLGSAAFTAIELAGLGMGEFDALNVAGDLHLGGGLGISLIEAFELGANQEFLIANVDGALWGQFSGLAEGDLVGTFGEYDLFISYQRGDGNDVSLFTAVPEPGHAFCLLVAGLAILNNRRRRSS